MTVFKAFLAVCTTLPLLLVSYISMCFMIWSISLAMWLEHKLMNTDNIKKGIAKASLDFAGKIYDIMRNPG